MASLMWGYYSLIIRASQFSSTTRNLVPRFKRGVRGGLVILWIFLKKLIPFVDVFNSLFQSIMMKLSSFLRGTPSYLRIGKGQLYNDRMSQGKFIWGYPKNELMSISRVEQMKHIESRVGQCNKKFRADRQSFIA